MSDETVFPKYMSIDRLGHDENSGILESGQLVVKEKLDGANFRFMLERNVDHEYQTDDRDIVFGSKNVPYKNDRDIDSNFEHAVEFVREQADADALRDIEDEYDEPIVVYDEAMHAHTLDYGEPEKRHGAQCWAGVPSVLGFDVRCGSELMDWPSAESIIETIGLDTVPVFYVGQAADKPDWIDPTMDDGIECPDSAYRDGIPEGIVIVNESTGQYAKYRTPTFKERHGAQSVTDPDDYDPSDGQVLARQYTTEARVLKMIHKYEDRGRSVNSMSVMEDLWRDVFDDIIEEEYDTIFLGNHTIDTQEFRSEVASITADVLEMYLNRPDGSVLNENND